MHPLDIDKDKLNPALDYHWVCFSILKQEDYILDLDSLPLDNNAKAYISNLIHFKHQIIDNGFNPVQDKALLSRKHSTNSNNNIKYGGLILCSKPKEQSLIKASIVEEQLNTMLAQAKADGQEYGFIDVHLTISDTDPRKK